MGRKTIFRDAAIFDGESPDLLLGMEVEVENDKITAIYESINEVGENSEIINCAGRFLMPGLIDAHVHVYAATLNISKAVQSPLSYLAHFAAKFMKSSLDRGFTTLRDVGGAEIGLATALKEGLLDIAPRLFYGGRAISQTGGHGDFRPGDHALEPSYYCHCHSHVDALAVIADGVDAVRRAVREELRRGASHMFWFSVKRRNSSFPLVLF